MTAGPVPVPTPLTAPFWEGASRGELCVQRCSSCEEHRFPPRPFCPSCTGPLEWVAIAGRGVVASFAINHRPDPRFGTAEPQILAIVVMEVGVRMATNLVDVESDAVRIGMPVSVRFIPRGSLLLPVFAPDPS